MNEEEKEAIDRIKYIVGIYNCWAFTSIRHEDLEIALNYIEKQQKEIEEYKKRLTPTPDNYVPIEYQTIMYVDRRNYISRDKIKAKIKEIEEKDKKYKHFMSDGREEFVIETIAIPILKELLGEEND